MPKKSKSTSKSKSISKSKSKSMVTHMETTDHNPMTEDPVDVPECAIGMCPLDHDRWLVALATDVDLATVLLPALPLRALEALACTNRACATALRPHVDQRARPVLWAALRHYNGPQAEFLKGAYYRLSNEHAFFDVYDDGHHPAQLATELRACGASADEPVEYYKDSILKCVDETPELVTFEFARRALGTLRVPRHELTRLCLNVIDNTGIVDSRYPHDAPLVVVPIPNAEGDHDPRWEGIEYYPDDPAIDHDAIVCMYDLRDRRRERVRGRRTLADVFHLNQFVSEEFGKELPLATLRNAVSLVRGPRHRPPLTRRDAPTCNQVLRTMLQPALDHLEDLGIVYQDRHGYKCAIGSTPEETDTLLNDLEEIVTGGGTEWLPIGVIGYSNLNGNFDHGSRNPFDELELHFRVCDILETTHHAYSLVRVAMERAGFVVEWDDSVEETEGKTKEEDEDEDDPSWKHLVYAPLVLRLAEGNDPYEREEHAYDFPSTLTWSDFDHNWRFVEYEEGDDGVVRITGIRD